MKKIVLMVVFAAMLLGLAGCGKKESAEDKLKKAINEFNNEVFNSEKDSDDSNDKNSEKSNIFEGIFN